MSIAQHFVAGEGEVRPQQTAEIEVPADSAALTAFRCDSVNLPWIIFRAAFRANHIEQLPQRARAVLSALARTVDAAHPFGAIYARREVLTGRAMQSMRTFYRSLDDLEDANLIERRPQSRYVEIGKFGRSHLHLTPRAAVLLGFVEAETATAPSEVPSPVVEPVDQPANALPFAGPCVTVADGAIYGDLIPASFQKRQPGQLPVDLQRLRSLGFIDFLIFKLMREAREAGKRLSEVVEVTWEHLKVAKRPINYLRALLRSPVDFGHQLRSKSEALASEQLRIERAAQADLIAQQCAGQTFIDVTGQHQYVVAADGQSMVVYMRDEGVGRQAAGWQDKFAEAIQAGRIREASQDDLGAFARSVRESTSRTAHAAGRAGQYPPEKPRVTQEVRNHIAGLHDLLRGHRPQVKLVRTPY